jgi:hypothetical protein
MNDAEDRTMRHDQLVQACRDAAAKLDHSDVGRSFVASFSSRRLEWRGVLPSFVVCRQLPEHDFVQSPIFTGYKRGSCSICGLESPEFDIKVGGNVLVANLGKAYYLQNSLASLEQFALTEPPNPTEEDVSLFSQTIQRLRDREETKLGELQRTIQGIFPSNKFQREDLLASLALAGVFEINAASYLDGWVTYDIRESVMPSHFFARDSPHPLRHYTSDCVLNEEAIAYWFADMATPVAG